MSEGDVGDRRGTVGEECDGLDLGVVIREVFGRCHPCSEGKGLAVVRVGPPPETPCAAPHYVCALLDDYP